MGCGAKFDATDLGAKLGTEICGAKVGVNTMGRASSLRGSLSPPSPLCPCSGSSAPTPLPPPPPMSPLELATATDPAPEPGTSTVGRPRRLPRHCLPPLRGLAGRVRGHPLLPGRPPSRATGGTAPRHHPAPPPPALPPTCTHINRGQNLNTSL